MNEKGWRLREENEEKREKVRRRYGRVE